MATIGLDKLYVAAITEDDEGIETYGTPEVLAKAISADIEIETTEAILYGDDAIAEQIKEFSSGTLTLNTCDLLPETAAILLGCEPDSNGVLVSSDKDEATAVAIGFRARKRGKTYRYIWLYRVVFAVPAENYVTKGESIEFQTPTIEGTIERRHKPDNRAGGDSYPWKAEITGDGTGANSSTISGWFTEVYEPEFTTQGSDM